RVRALVRFIPLFDGSVLLSEKLLELLDSQTRVLSDTTHRVCVDWVVARNRKDSATVRHDDVLAFANDLEPGLLQGADRLEVRHAGDLGHYTETSTSRTSAPRVCSVTTARYSWMAERTFSRASASVSPWDQQPGKPGTDAAT